MPLTLPLLPAQADDAPRQVGAVRPIVRRFTSESQLVEAAMRQSRWEAAEDRNLAGLVRELPTPTGVTDLLFYRLRKDWQRHSLVRDVHPRWAFALSCLPYRRVFDTGYAATLFGVSERTAKAAMSKFVELGLCRATKHRSKWIKTRELVMPAVELVAVEAKLRDWQKALFQASGNLSFSDHSWVLLDAATTGAALRRPELFRSRGVGLACLSSSGELSVKIAAQPSGRIQAYDRQFVNSELMKRLTPS